MSDKTSQSGTSHDSLDHEGSGICAPVRLTHPIPRQRYGWPATMIVLAHALLLGVFLMRFDFMSDGPAPSRPETLDIIVVDLSGHRDTTPPAEPVAEPTLTSPPQPAPLTLPSASQPIHEVPTIPVESTTQPVVETLPPNKEASTTAPPESSARSEAPSPESTPTSKAEPPVPPAPAPAPAPKTAAAAVSKNMTTASSSATKGAPQQPAITQNRDAESQTTPPRLDPAYLHNPAPNYPALSKRNRESGTVLLLVKVDEDGSAAAVTLHKSSGYDRLDQAAIQAVSRWRFVPGMRGQTAISATVIVPISFKQP